MAVDKDQKLALRGRLVADIGGKGSNVKRRGGEMTEQIKSGREEPAAIGVFA
jgi:hypothetical protein